MDIFRSAQSVRRDRSRAMAAPRRCLDGPCSGRGGRRSPSRRAVGCRSGLGVRCIDAWVAAWACDGHRALDAGVGQGRVAACRWRAGCRAGRCSRGAGRAGARDGDSLERRPPGRVRDRLCRAGHRPRSAVRGAGRCGDLDDLHVSIGRARDGRFRFGPRVPGARPRRDGRRLRRWCRGRYRVAVVASGEFEPSPSEVIAKGRFTVR